MVDFDPMTFTVCDADARGDADDNGTVNFADITNVLETFNLVGCPPPPESGHLADGDADRDFADLTAVLDSWLQNYCLFSGQSIAGKGGGPADHMDFEGEAPMSAADAAGIISNALAQMGYASIEAFADAYAQMSEAERTAEMRRLGQLLGGAE